MDHDAYATLQKKYDELLLSMQDALAELKVLKAQNKQLRLGLPFVKSSKIPKVSKRNKLDNLQNWISADCFIGLSAGKDTSFVFPLYDRYQAYLNSIGEPPTNKEMFIFNLQRKGFKIDTLGYIAGIRLKDDIVP